MQTTKVGSTVVHSYHVLDSHQGSVFRGEPNLSIAELAPRTSNPYICVFNGEPILRADWHIVPEEGDHVAFQVLPLGGGNASQSILGIVLIVGGLLTGNPEVAWAGAALLVTGLLAPPTFVPLANNQQTSPSPTYSLQLSGNAARLGQSIPVLYGVHILVPDFAAQPYSEYDENGDQFYCAILCLGQLDKFTLKSTMIDDTELSHFTEVQKQLVGPQYSRSLSLVSAAVVNAPEVANNDLFTNKPVGPFAASGPGLLSVEIAVDIACPKGLYFAADDGSLQEKTVQWFIEARTITSTGAQSGDWKLLGNETITDSTNNPIRRSYKYKVAAGRYEVRCTRLDVRDDNARAGHDLQWIGLRAYLDVPNPLEPTATFLAIRMKATSQLNSLSQRRITCIISRWLPTWNPTTGWGPPKETASIAWALADVMKNSTYGGQIPDNYIDLQSLYELDQVWASRGDTFNGVFDSRVTVWSALTSIARAGRAVPIMRGSVYTFVRDDEQDLPVALFSMRNIVRGSFGISYNLLVDDESDGLELQFFNHETWSSDYVTVRINDDNTIEVVTGTMDGPINPTKMQIMGVSNLAQATREALHIVGDAVYRRSTVTFDTELEGFLPAFGSLIAVTHDVVQFGHSGDAEDWDETTRTMVCTEELTWSIGSSYAILTDSRGNVCGPYLVEPGDDERTMRFVDPVAVEVYVGTERERTRYSMGPANAYARMCKVRAIVPKDDGVVGITAVVDDKRVYPLDDGGGSAGSGDRVARYAPSGVPKYDAASDAQHDAYGFYSNADSTVGSNSEEGYTYAN